MYCTDFDDAIGYLEGFRTEYDDLEAEVMSLTDIKEEQEGHIEELESEVWDLKEEMKELNELLESYSRDSWEK